MKSLIIAILTTGLASATNLECSGIQNTKLMYTQKISINSRSEVMLPTLGYLTSKIKSMGNNQYEIEVFNPALAARGYATASIKANGDFVKWSHWDREAIFEIACIQR